MMRKKILIVETDENERERLEQALVEIVDEGGELFFVSTHDEALKIVEAEHPPLIFVDVNLLGDHPKRWTQHGGHLVLMLEKKQEHLFSGDKLIKPVKSEKVLDTCRTILESLTEPAPPLPPM